MALHTGEFELKVCSRIFGAVRVVHLMVGPDNNCMGVHVVYLYISCTPNLSIRFGQSCAHYCTYMIVRQSNKYVHGLPCGQPTITDDNGVVSCVLAKTSQPHFAGVRAERVPIRIHTYIIRLVMVGASHCSTECVPKRAY